MNEINCARELETTSALLQQYCCSEGVSGEKKTANHVKNVFDLLSYVADKSEIN